MTGETQNNKPKPKPKVEKSDIKKGWTPGQGKRDGPDPNVPNKDGWTPGQGKPKPEQGSFKHKLNVARAKVRSIIKKK